MADIPGSVAPARASAESALNIITKRKHEASRFQEGGCGHRSASGRIAGAGQRNPGCVHTARQSRSEEAQPEPKAGAWLDESKSPSDISLICQKEPGSIVACKRSKPRRVGMLTLTQYAKRQLISLMLPERRCLARLWPRIVRRRSAAK
jgi:hypothetical protein